MRVALSGFLDAAGMSSQSRTALRSVIRNGGRLMGVTWLENLLGLAYFAVMARYLGPAQYGHWAYGTSTYGLVIALVGFGLDTLVMMELGRDRQRAAATIGLMLTLRVALLIFGAIGLGAYACVEPDPESRLVLLLLIPALLGRGVAVWIRMCFLGHERMGDYAQVAAAVRIAEFTLGVLYLVSGGGVVGIAVLHSLCWVVEAGAGLRRIRSRLTRYRLHIEWRRATDLLAQGAVLGVTIGGDTWLISGPIMLLRYSHVGMTELGQFATGLTVTMILVGATQSFLAAALPVLSRSAPEAPSGMAAYARLIAAGSIVVAGCLAILGWLFGPSFAVWALGPSFAVTGALLAPFLLVTGVILIPTAYVQVLLVSGLKWPWVAADLAGGLWLAAAFPAAVAAWNLDGAVLATGSAWFIRAAILVVASESLVLHPRPLRPAG